jgi:hypothetical protein
MGLICACGNLRSGFQGVIRKQSSLGFYVFHGCYHKRQWQSGK